MLRLLKIELVKLKSYRTFWIIMAGYGLLTVMVAGAIKNFQVDGVQLDAANIYSFPDIWHNIAYLASFLNLLLGILMILLVTNEYTFRTLRQNVIDGLSRAEFVLAKFFTMLFIALLCGIFVFFFVLFAGLKEGQFKHFDHILDKIHFMPLLVIQITGYMTLAAFFGFLIKRAALSIVAFLAYAVLIERIIRMRTPDNIDRYFPMNVLNDLITLPGKEQVQMYTGLEMEALPPVEAAALSAVLIALLMFGSFGIIKRADL